MQTLSAKVQEVLENGGFTRLGLDDAGRDIFQYERTGRDGVEFTEAQIAAQRPYKLTVIAGRFCVSCTCPEGCSQVKAGDGKADKHQQALEYMLSADVPVIAPVKVQAEELKVVVAPAPSGWAMLGL